MNHGLQALTVEMQRKNTSERRRNAQMIQSCVTLTKRAHKPQETGVPSKVHPRDKVRAHLPASQRKEGLGECRLGLANP